MFQRFFGRGAAANRRIVDALYASIVAAARHPHHFSQWEVPDTPLGRFEMISLHMFLLQHRLRDETGPAREVAQELIDGFFTEVEHSLRELGIGDLGIPKRMKKLARMFYGRTTAYAAALEAGDRAALAAALTRNILPGQAQWPHAATLAAYVEAADAGLRDQTIDAILGGTVMFPDPVALGAEASS